MKFIFWQLLEYFDTVESKDNFHRCIIEYPNDFTLRCDIFPEQNEVVINYFFKRVLLFEITFTELMQIGWHPERLLLHKNGHEDPFKIMIRPEFSISLDFTRAGVKNLD